MKTAKTIIVAMFVAVGLGTDPAAADPCTFDPFEGDEGIWRLVGNWDNCGFDYPEAGDTVTIPDEKMCTVEITNEECDWIDVQAGGELRIRKGTTLTILTDDEDSTVDGILSIGWGTFGVNKLLIAADVTIQGHGGVIRMGPDSVIDDNGASEYRLTIEGDRSRCADPGYMCSLAITGQGGDIKVTLTNNAYVLPDTWVTDCACSWIGAPITLSENPKNGSGVWGAKELGHLQVDVEVTGDGTWQMIDEDAECACATRITINHPTTVFGGNVNLEHGTFMVNENFCTTGDLTWKSETIDGGTSTATIDVAEDKVARFGGTCVGGP